ncbi:MAG: hypothetical protein NUW37_06905 [Planctomycetes bacterium]|nr:hypothetical protein [Planctomycetota bacterium]
MTFVGNIPVFGTSGGPEVMRDLRIGQIYSRRVTTSDLTASLPNQSFNFGTLPPLSFVIAAWIQLDEAFTGTTATFVVGAVGVAGKQFVNGEPLLGVSTGLKNTSPGPQFDGSQTPIDFGGGTLMFEIASDQNVDELTTGDATAYVVAVVLS